MRKICLWVAFLAAVMDASAQKISRKVMPSGGGSLTANNVQLSFTIGETVIPTFSTSANMISQGFQQPSDPNATTELKGMVDLATFDARADYRTAKLLFVTNTSFKTDYLIVERLNNETGKFDNLEHRNIISGNDDLLQYYFTDKNPQDDDNFYRIKQVYLQGTFSYTDVRKLNFSKAGVISIFPNPASEYLLIDLSPHFGKDAAITIFSELGQSMFQQKIENIGKDFIKIPLDNMDMGNYQIQIAVKGKSSFTRQFVVAK